MGTIASASASSLYCSTEAAWGSTAGGNYQTARITSMDIRNRQTNVSSNELSTAAEPLAQIRVDASAEGSVNFETMVEAGNPQSATVPFEMFLQSLFWNTWSTALGISADIDVVSGAGWHWSATAGTFTNVNAGDWVRSANFVNSANNGVFYVSAKTSSSDITVANAASVAETTGTAITVSGSRLVFGNTISPLSMEQKVASATTLYEQATGMVASTMSIEIATGALLTGQVQFAGKRVSQSTSSIAGTPVTVGTGTILNPVDHILGIYEGTMGTAETWRTQRFALNLARNATPLGALGVFGSVGIRSSRPVVSASTNIYVEHGSAETGGVKDLQDAFIAGSTRNGFAVHVGVSGSANYVFMFQSYNITNSGLPVGGNDSDFFLPLEIAATVNSTTNTAFSVHKV